MDMEWPDGTQGDLVLRGLGRDIVTTADGAAVVLGEASLQVTATSNRVVWRVSSQPSVAALADLGGSRLGLASAPPRAPCSDRATKARCWPCSSTSCRSPR
jgi:hypothetical protein